LVLENHFLVIRPDLPGTGKSHRWDETGIGIEDYAAAVLAI